MCPPLLAAIPAGVSAAISAGSAAIGTGVAIGGAVAKGAADAKAGEDARIAGLRNQFLAEVAASDAVDRSRLAQGEVKAQAGRIMGAQKSAYAAGGVDVHAGTTGTVARETAIYADAEVEAIKANAAREAWGYKVAGAQSAQEGEDRAEIGRASFYSSLLGAAGEGLFRAGSIFSSLGRDSPQTEGEGTTKTTSTKSSGLFGSTLSKPVVQTAPAPLSITTKKITTSYVPPTAPLGMGRLPRQ